MAGPPTTPGRRPRSRQGSSPGPAGHAGRRQRCPSPAGTEDGEPPSPTPRDPAAADGESESARERRAAEDRLLWAAALAGDPQAEGRLWSLVEDDLRRRLSRIGLLCAADRDDLVASARQRIFELVKSGEPAPKNLRGFLHYRALGALKSFRRSRDRAPQELALGADSPAADSSPEPGERIAQAELLEALRICRQRLAPELRWIVEMHYDEEISQRRIAASLALSTDAVHRRLRRGLHFLHDCLRARGIRP